jgi:hypothetical protein
LGLAELRSIAAKMDVHVLGDESRVKETIWLWNLPRFGAAQWLSSTTPALRLCCALNTSRGRGIAPALGAHSSWWEF